MRQESCPDLAAADQAAHDAAAVTSVPGHGPAPHAVVMCIRHDADIATQLRPWLFRRAPVQLAYWTCNLAAVAAIAALGAASPAPFDAYAQACLGMGLAYALLLPLHEWLHAAAYRALGHRRVAITYRWRTLTAFCTADGATLSGPQFSIVCLVPSLVINPLLLVAVALTVGPMQLLCAGALLLHLAAASGDIALVGLAWHFRDRMLWTCDDLERGESLFWVVAE